MKNNININYLKVKGYTNLTPKAKEVFQRMDRKHTDAVEDKAAWTPTRVKEKRDHIQVYFTNGQWLHYHVNGSWY